MKLQYLGDSKDSFKWDYHNYLVEALGYSQLVISWMMTPDDGGTNGRTPPEKFPAREEILHLCKLLRANRNLALLLDMPRMTEAHYTVGFHNSDMGQNCTGRDGHTADTEPNSDKVLFIDPDNGFEPERKPTDKHVRYTDIDRIIQSVSPGSVVTVFQHHRRRKFPEDYARISERLLSGYSTAIYWHSLMFVCMSSSSETIQRVCNINREYAKQRPVKTLP